MALENVFGDLALDATLQALLTELGQKLEAGGTVALDAPTLAALEMTTATISNLPADYPDAGALTALGAILAALASVPVTGPLTNAQLRAAVVPVSDAYTALEALEDQAAGGVLTFTFTAPVDLIWVLVVGGTGRATTTQTPTTTLGAYCDEDTPNPLTVRTTTVKVLATAGSVSVWGYR